MPNNTATIVRELSKLLSDETALSFPDRCARLKELRQLDSDSTSSIDIQLMRAYDQIRTALRTANDGLQQQHQEIRALTEPPLFPTTFLQALDDNQALVFFNGSQRVVTCHRDVDCAPLGVGDTVLLNAELNVLLEFNDAVKLEVGELAEFVRAIDSSRLVVRSRDEQLVVRQARDLDVETLHEGDLLRVDRNSRIAFERIEKHVSRNYFVDDPPNGSLSNVGGNRQQIKQLKRFIRRTCCHQDIATKYLLSGQQSILLYGPPGCGKTLLVRSVAAELSQQLNQRFRLAIVKPAEFEDPYVGVTQSKIRSCFESLRAESEDCIVVVYLDEIEAVGRIRGTSFDQHQDKFLAAMLAEIDGFSARGNIAIIASTNRKDLLDPALLERLSDLEIHVPRPSSQDAREIIDVHFPETIPVHQNGASAKSKRQALIEHTVSRFYAPNSGNLLSQIKFRDGSTSPVHCKDLISGRIIKQVCQTALQLACDREIVTGNPGICQDDMDLAIDEVMDRMASTLTPGNARTYLPELARDVDIIDITRLHQPLQGPFRYLSNYSN